MNMKKNVYITSVGCRLNQFEVDILKSKFKQLGCETNIEKDADICVINTCTVTKNADVKSKKLIKSIIKKFSKSFVVVTGCLAETNPEFIKSIKGVDLVVDNKNKMRIPELILKNNSLKEDIIYTTDRSKPYIKIQDGCNLLCSYCKVRIARGRSVSENFEKILKTAEFLSKQGYPEIFITGINIGDYNYDGKNLANLLKSLIKIDNLERIRLTSIEPNYIDDELLEVLKSEKICGYFHIPLQSGSDRILKLMNRPYKASDYEKIVNRIREIRKDSIIGSDVIVGFPSETEEDFLATYNLLKRLNIFYLHIFRYSKREGTLAYNLGNEIDENIKIMRAKILNEYKEKSKKEFFKNCVGKVFSALIENKLVKSNFLKALTDNYIPVFINKEEAKNFIKEIVKVEVIDFDGKDLYGKIL